MRLTCRTERIVTTDVARSELAAMKEFAALAVADQVVTVCLRQHRVTPEFTTTLSVRSDRLPGDRELRLVVAASTEI